MCSYFRDGALGLKAETAGNLRGFRGDPFTDPLQFFFRQAARGTRLIYVPSGLRSLLYAQTVRRGRRLVAGPNVTHLPLRRADFPGRLELHHLVDLWLEASEARRALVAAYARTERVLALPHGLDLEAFGPHLRREEIWPELGVPGTGLRLLFAGRDAPSSPSPSAIAAPRAGEAARRPRLRLPA